MKKGDLLFVYGSLRCGEQADLSTNMMATLVGDDRINGKLYGVSWFPGAKDVPETTDGPFTPDNPTIVGSVFRLRNASIISMLDSYEGYPDLYERHQTMTEGGRKVWVYVYNHGVSEDQRVPGGDWCPKTPVIRVENAA